MTVSKATKRQALAQVAFCVGCCCGRVDRGYPPVPVEEIKTIWKAEKLNTAVQLTISGCLGPCDCTNVALVITPTSTVWLGGLATTEDYQHFVAWAKSCKNTGQLQPLPAELTPKQFDRFAPAAI